MVNNEEYLSKMLWKGSDILRGCLDAEVAQGVLREVFFLKLLNSLINKDDYFKERINGKLEFNNSEELFEKLDDFIEKNEIFEGLFKDIYTIKYNKDDRFLDSLIGLFSNDDVLYDKEINPSKLLRETLEISAGGKKLVNTTSLSIRRLISELLYDREIEEVYDPCVGYGSLLLEVVSHHKDVKIYGQDINDESIRICKMQMILEKRIEDLSNIKQGNTIVNPGNVMEDELKKFDCIISNPPFALKDWGYNEVVNCDKYNIFYRGIPSRSLGDYAFITHVIESLNSNGIGIMVEPSGVLFREGAEGRIREKIICENLIDAVIALPGNMMFGTAIPVNLIIFNKAKKEKDIFFIDLTREVAVNKVLTTLSDDAIKKVVKVYQERSEIEGFSRRVSMEEIEGNNFNLSVQRYIEELVEKEDLNIKDIKKEIEYLTDKLQSVQKQIDSLL